MSALVNSPVAGIYAALKDVQVDVVPVKIFYEWMESKGKVGGQNKFPRVLKNAQLEEWQSFLAR